MTEKYDWLYLLGYFLIVIFLIYKTFKSFFLEQYWLTLFAGLFLLFLLAIPFLGKTRENLQDKALNFKNNAEKLKK